MAGNTTIDIATLDADVIHSETAIAPPFGRTKKPYDRGLRGNRQMRWSCIAANVNFGLFGQCIKALQREIEPTCLPSLAGTQYFLSQILLPRAIGYQRVK